MILLLKLTGPSEGKHQNQFHGIWELAGKAAPDSIPRLKNWLKGRMNFEDLEKEVEKIFNKPLALDDLHREHMRLVQLGNSFRYSRQECRKSKSIKKFDEEVIPVEIFLDYYNKKSIMESIEFCSGNQNFDAVLTTASKKIFLEVVFPKDGHAEAFEAELLDKYGSTPTGRSVQELKKILDSGKKPQREFRLRDIAAEDVAFDKIVDSIGKKVGKCYPENTILIVALNQSHLRRDDEWKELHWELSQFEKCKTFIAIYIVNMWKHPNDGDGCLKIQD